MAHQPKGQHWRDLGKAPSVNSTDKSNGAVLKALAKPRDPSVVTAHSGVASVGASGIKPTQPKTDDGNTVANEAFNKAAQGQRERPNVVMIGGK